MLLLVSFNFCFLIVNLILNLTLNLILNIGLILILKLILKFDFDFESNIDSDFEFDFVSLDCRFVVLQLRLIADLRTPSCQDPQLSGPPSVRNRSTSRWSLRWRCVGGPQAVRTPGRKARPS